jgi:hypothetical protein
VTVPDGDEVPLEHLMEVAEQITAVYESAAGLVMALVTGSVARGLADGSSDLDLYLYWEHVDGELLSSSAIGRHAGGSRLFGTPTATGFFEKYQFGDRLVDVESVSIRTLADLAGILDRHEPMSALTAKTMAGLRDAIPVRGDAQLELWRSRLSYSSEQGLVEVAVNLRRFLPPMAIYELTMVRGDSISFFSRLSAVALAAIGAVAALNMYALPTQDPKWLPWHVAQLTKRPPDFMRRLQAPFTQHDVESIVGFDAALSGTLDLVEHELPAALPEVQRARFVLAFPTTTVQSAPG